MSFTGRTALVVALCLLLPGSALAHGTVEHGDPRQALPDTLVTQPVAAEEYGSLEPPSFEGGSAPETWCGTTTTANNTADAVVPAATPQFKLVYAYASDQPNRFDTLKHRLQANVSLLQRYLAGQSGGRKALRWDMGTDCGPQYVDIQVVALPKTRAEYVPGGAPNFALTRNDVFAAIGGVAAPRNIAIYADGLRGTNGVAGTASRYTSDSTHTTAHDSGGLGAVVFGPQTLPSSSYAEPAVLMHEIGHNLGAVQDLAPHSTKAGHCHDERDLMCYADGGTEGRAGDMLQNCSAIAGDMDETFDCGGDDYFNPKPAQGTYLDLNWNTYAVAHLAACSTELLDSCGLADAPADGTKPTNTTAVPANEWRKSWTPTLAGSDSESPIDAYQWRLGATNGTLQPIQHGREATVTGPHATQTNLWTRVRDSSGNWSAWRADAVMLDLQAPNATVTCPSSWSTTTAPACTYNISETTSGLESSETRKGTDPVAAGGASGTLVATADAQTIRVRGTDHAGNTGDWATATARWDRVNPAVSVTCPETWSAGPATCHVAASDAASGIGSVTWRVGNGPATTVAANSDFSVAEAGEQTITVVATDVAGRTSQATAMSRAAPSAAPSGSDRTVMTTEDAAAYAFTSSSFGFSDPDAGDALSAIRVDTLPAAGALKAGGTPVAAGGVHAPGTLTYTPAADGCGAPYASFTFSVRDSTAAFDPTPNTITIDVACVDDPPEAIAITNSGDGPTATSDADVAAGITETADTKAPETTIVKAPRKRVTTRHARVKVVFAFKSSEAASRFRCKLDTARFEPCRSPRAYRLKPGRHTFSVVAVDAAGNVDASPAVRKFRVVRP
jgi:hypothetical protein